MNKLLLVDGNSIMNRAFYGLPLLTDAKGRYTNAVFGFINILLRTIDTEKPSHVVIAFDRKAPTFRHLVYKEYKGNRKGMPDELRTQMPLVKEVLETMGVAMYEKDGIEADDILGTLSLQYEEKGIVSVLSGDRDMLQLASEKTTISIPTTKGGQTTTEHYDFQRFMDAYGFTPTQFIDVKGMMGDSSDNIPGIPGVGEKTAHKFIIKYHSLDGLYENIDDIKGKTREKIEANKELAYLSRELATIKRDCDIDLSDEVMQLQDYLNDKTFDLFKELNFTRLLSKFNIADIEEAKELEQLVVEEIPSIDMFLMKQLTHDFKSYAIYSYLDTDYAAIAIAGEDNNDETLYVIEITDLKGDSKVIGKQLSKDMARLIKGFDKTSLRFYDIKSFWHQFKLDEDLMTTRMNDLHLMFYLAKPNKGQYPLQDLGLNYTETNLEGDEELLGKGKSKKLFKELDKDKRLQYLGRSVKIISGSYKPLEEVLVSDNVLGLYNTLEKPLLKVLYSMEKEGVSVDKKILTDLSEQLAIEIDDLTSQIYTIAGEKFNINSPKQLGEILFDVMGLPVIKKTKTGYSTNAEVLEKLQGQSPIINLVLHYRQLTKLKSTYADGLFSFVEEDNKIHTTFNQTIASTGRLSSTEPNLQNIPIRLEQGRLIRKAFIPKEGSVFIDADYSQIELRLLAHISEDETFIKAYKENMDIHALTASQVFHIPFEKVTSAQRQNAKAVNFGIVYGISDFGLSRDLNIPIAESREYIEAYFNKYPKVKAFMDLTVAKAYEDGFVRTMYNRKRVIRELSSSNYMQRQAGERIAMNTPIQGSAADIIKIAMLKVYNRLRKENLKAKIILQVHDELILEAPLDEVDYVKELLSYEMEHAVDLLVPLTAESMTATNWYEAK